MAIPNKPVAAPKAQPAPRAPRVPKERVEVKLVSSNKKEQLRVKAEKNKAGEYITFLVHNNVGPDGKRQPGFGRGATQKHADFAAAKASLASTVKASVEKGWIQKTTGRSREDAFDLAHIPAPTA
jgi:hypothetical protein